MPNLNSYGLITDNSVSPGSRSLQGDPFPADPVIFISLQR